MTNEEQIVATAREYVESLSLPYPHLSLRIGGDHAYGVARAKSRITIDGIYVIPGVEMMGIHHVESSERRLGHVGEQRLDYLGHDVGYVLGRVARSEVVAFDALFGGWRENWMSLVQTPDPSDTFIVARALLAETHVFGMLSTVAYDRRQMIERSLVYPQTAHLAIHNGLMALCLADTGSVIIPYDHQLNIARTRLRASTVGGIERFIGQLRSYGLDWELTQKERGEESGVAAWLDDISSATRLALKDQKLPPTPYASAIVAANNWVVELRQRVKRVGEEKKG